MIYFRMGGRGLKSRAKHVPYSVDLSVKLPNIMYTEVLQPHTLVMDHHFLSRSSTLGCGWNALGVVAVVRTARGSGSAGRGTRPSTATALAVGRLNRS
jgi:hypothetical protein